MSVSPIYIVTVMCVIKNCIRCMNASLTALCVFSLTNCGDCSQNLAVFAWRCFPDVCVENGVFQIVQRGELTCLGGLLPFFLSLLSRYVSRYVCVICLFISPDIGTICFTICLFISPDLDGHRAPKKSINPHRVQGTQK